MNSKAKPTTLNRYERYTLETLILEDHEIGEWFVDVCIGRKPSATISEEILALMEGRGLIRKTDFGWVLGSEGRNFARNLGLIPGPSDIETNPLPAIAKSEFQKDRSINIDRVWNEFFTTRKDSYRNILLKHYLPIVKYAADRICAKMPDKAELDDLVSSGIFGLKDAIEAFDPNRGVKFETYCTPRIRGSILDELRHMDWIPRLARARAHHLEKVIQSFEAKFGRIPTEQELTEILKIDKEDFRRLQRDASTIGLQSLSNIINDNEDGKDFIENSTSQNPVINAKNRDLKYLLTKGLTRTEKLIIILYYYEEMTMKDIAAQLDLPESRVSQMHSSIIARLKANMNKRKSCSQQIQ